MKKAAISQRIDEHSERNETRDALDNRLPQFLLQTGVLPVPVPNELVATGLVNVQDSNMLVAWISEVKPHIIVLSGGNDIGACVSRDSTETELCRYASENNLPVWGICRGMQMMGALDGVPLKTVEGHVQTRHRLSGELAGEVNSYHDFSLETCPKNYQPLAHSSDGELEAMRHNQLPWEGWMWHPERETEFRSRDIDRVRALFES